jgi:hypothetical protein
MRSRALAAFDVLSLVVGELAVGVGQLEQQCARRDLEPAGLRGGLGGIGGRAAREQRPEGIEHRASFYQRGTRAHERGWARVDGRAGPRATPPPFPVPAGAL